MLTALATGLLAAMLLLQAPNAPLGVDARRGSPEPTTDAPPAGLAAPAARFGMGSLHLDQPLTEAVELLGLPASSEPDIFGTAYRWPLPGGASVVVSAWDDGVQEINGLFASVPHLSGAAVSTFGGVTIGSSTLTAVIDVWGEDFTPAESAANDYVVSYVDCVGPYPVVVKFDQEAATATDFPFRGGAPLLDRPVTSVLIAYADAEPGSSGCSA